MRIKKTEQQKEAEGFFKKLFKLFASKKIDVRTHYDTEDLGIPGSHRVVITYKERRK